HLYLGLLYGMRGRLGLAVEHLKFAGAPRVVAEIEESLRRSPREIASRAGSPAASSRPTPPGRPVPVQPAPSAPPPPVASVVTEELSDTNPAPAAANETNPAFRPAAAPPPT